MALNISSFITSTPLENFSVQHLNDLQNDFAALKLAPELMVKKSVGKWYQYARDAIRAEILDAPSGTEAPSSNLSVFTNTYTAKEKAHKMLVLGKDARDADIAVADLDRDAAATNVQKLWIDLESAVATKATTAANYPSANVLTLSGGDTWADSAGSPLEDVQAIREAVFVTSGKYPNVMAISQKGLSYLKLHPDIVDRLKYTNGGPVSLQQIAALFELEQIIVSKAAKNTGVSGGTDSVSTIWGDSAVVAYVDPNPGLRSMTFMRTLMVNRLYTKPIDAPELGRELGAHWIESGLEYAVEFAAQVSDTDGDAIAGGLIANIY